MKRTEYKNKHKKTKYDRLEIVLPIGYKDKIKEVAALMNISVNDYVGRLIKHDLEYSHTPQNLICLLNTWGVKKKYHHMIESASYTKLKGYFIKLKHGFINDEFECDEIICKTSKEIRHIMQFTHPIRTEEEMQGFDSKTYEQLLRWQVPKCYFKIIKSVAPYQINFKNGEVWKFNSVYELRYMWKSLKNQ